MAHIDEVFPQNVSPGSEGLIESLVDVIRNPAGYDVRVKRRNWKPRKFNPTFSLRQSDGTPDTGKIYDIINFWEAADGPLNTFKFIDRLDYKSCRPNETPTALDVSIGTGDGSTDEFQIRKSYSVGSTTVYRNILCPKASSLLVALNGSPTTSYTVDEETGLITFTSPPGSGVVITAGFVFYCKVRFDMQDLSAVYEGFRVGSVGSVQLIEVIQ